MTSDNVYLKQMEIGPMENFVYLIGDKNTREVFVVDPAWQVDTILKKAKEEDLKIKGALISHFHFDHTNGIEELLKSVDCPVYVNKKDASSMECSHGNIRNVDDGHRVKIGQIEISLIHTPGHTPGFPWGNNKNTSRPGSIAGPWVFLQIGLSFPACSG